jgi:hypothetical protein
VFVTVGPAQAQPSPPERPPPITRIHIREGLKPRFIVSMIEAKPISIAGQTLERTM